MLKNWFHPQNLGRARSRKVSFHFSRTFASDWHFAPQNRVQRGPVNLKIEQFDGNYDFDPSRPITKCKLIEIINTTLVSMVLSQKKVKTRFSIFQPYQGFKKMKLEWRDLEFMVRYTFIAFLGFLCKTTTLLKPLLPYINFQKIRGSLLVINL